MLGNLDYQCSVRLDVFCKGAVLCVHASMHHSCHLVALLDRHIARLDFNDGAGKVAPDNGIWGAKILDVLPAG